MKITTLVTLAGAAVALVACNTSSNTGPPSTAPAPTTKAGDACTGKDSKGATFKGTLGQETKGGLVCVPGGGAR